MALTDPSELKRQLRAAGFEIYRSAHEQVMLAERIRDNLIMDSGVAALFSESKVAIQVTVRAQASHFPGADEGQLWAQARLLAKSFLDLGFSQHDTRSEPVPDPNDPEKSLDTSHEILLRRDVVDLESLFKGLRVALEQKRSTNDD